MKIVRSVHELKESVRELKQAGKRIGFVPTMGALHDGHLSLIEAASRHADSTVVSIFVNPTQFGANEDFAKYPRNQEQDLRLLERTKADLVYLPSQDDMYPAGHQIMVDPGDIGTVLEGKFRPGHFRGVLTIVAKLFMQVQPNTALFGQKDAQQLFLIRKMVKDLDIPVEIVASPTVREKDGLALSSRNRFLKESERERAGIIYEALRAATESYKSGVRSLNDLQSAMKSKLESVKTLTIDYATCVDENSFEEWDTVSDYSRFLIAVRLGSVRLIDNLAPNDPIFMELSSEGTSI